MRVEYAAGAVALAVSMAMSPIAAGADPCASSPAKLGVSRVVEVDTARGPRLGQNQYKDIDLLGDKEIVLTFDDGPLRSHTRAVLDALAAHCTKGTFFMVGRMAAIDADMVKDVARAGHTIGTHTYSHRNLATLVPQRAIAEVELGLSTVRKAVGVPIAPFFRFPYLAESKFILAHAQSRGLGVFSIDVDAYDYRTRSPQDVRRNVLGQLATKGKGIILFHDIQPSTARALAGLLDELNARGFKVVHLVAKQPVVTLADYDAMAETELSKTRVASAANPLAKRSVVWPATATTVVPAAGQGPLAAPAPAISSSPAPAAPAAASNSDAAERANARRSEEDLGWRGRIFRN